VGVFAAAEDDREDDFVFLGQELFGPIDLGHQVVVANFWANAEFFVFAVVRMPLVLPLLLLVLEFAEIHDSADGRLFLRSDLDKIEANFFGTH
jgi:hypothetical protein